MKMQHYKDLIGRTFQHEWTNGKYKGVIYNVEFLSDKELRWTGIEGFPKGKTDIQRYKIKNLDEDIYQFSWLADDGLSVTITYNFNNSTAEGIVINKEEKNILKGSLRVIKI